MTATANNKALLTASKLNKTVQVDEPNTWAKVKKHESVKID